jgi:hypothetical protein
LLSEILSDPNQENLGCSNLSQTGILAVGKLHTKKKNNQDTLTIEVILPKIPSMDYQVQILGLLCIISQELILDTCGTSVEETLAKAVPLLNDAAHQFDLNEMKSEPMQDINDTISNVMPNVHLLCDTVSGNGGLEKLLRKVFAEDD